MSPKAQISSHKNKSWRTHLSSLFAINSPSKDIERRRQAELLAGLMVLMLGFQLLSLPLFLGGIFDNETLPNYIFSTLLFVIIYFFNQRGYYLVAAYIFVWGMFLAIHLTLLADMINLIFYAVLLFLVSGIFLSLRTTTYLMLTSFVLQLGFALTKPQTFIMERPDPLIFTLFGGPIIFILIRHRLGVERERQIELKQAIEAVQESEARWRSVVTNAPDLILELDQDYIIRFINRVSKGHSSTEVIGNHINEFILPEYQEGIIRAIQNVSLTTRIVEYGGKSIRLNKMEVWFSATISPIVQFNEITGYILISRDVSEHKKAEFALQNYEGHRRDFQGYLTQLHDIRAQLASYEILDDMYKRAVEIGIEQLHFDRMALFLIDYETLTVKGTYGTDDQGKLRHELDYEDNLNDVTWSRVLQAEESVSFWLESDLIDYGQTVGRGWKAMAGLWDGKKAIGFMAVDNLLSHYPARPYEEELIAIYSSVIAQTILHKHAEQQRIDLAVQHEQMQLLEELISDLSHDIRTPLTSINNYLYLLKTQPDSPKRDNHLTALENQVLRLSRLVEDILAMARLDKGTVLDFNLVSIPDLLEAIIHNYQQLADTQQIQIDYKPGDLPPVIKANALELGRALSNLVENAVNYTEDGGKISIVSYVQPNQIFIEISDTGIGIESEELSHIFDRFYRADKARNTIKGGSGLGLAIVKKVIELHKGEIEVESQVGAGTLFRISLPHGS